MGLRPITQILVLPWGPIGAQLGNSSRPRSNDSHNSSSNPANEAPSKPRQAQNNTFFSCVVHRPQWPFSSPAKPSGFLLSSHMHGFMHQKPNVLEQISDNWLWVSGSGDAFNTSLFFWPAESPIPNDLFFLLFTMHIHVMVFFPHEPATGSHTPSMITSPAYRLFHVDFIEIDHPLL